MLRNNDANQYVLLSDMYINELFLAWRPSQQHWKLIFFFSVGQVNNGKL